MFSAGPSLKVTYTIPLEDLTISLVPGEEREFNITSSVRSCSLRARNVHERNLWLEALNSAVEEQRSRKASFTKTGELYISDIYIYISDIYISDGEDSVSVCSNSQLGDLAPVWVPDSHVTRYEFI